MQRKKYRNLFSYFKNCGLIKYEKMSENIFIEEFILFC